MQNRYDYDKFEAAEFVAKIKYETRAKRLMNCMLNMLIGASCIVVGYHVTSESFFWLPSSCFKLFVIGIIFLPPVVALWMAARLSRTFCNWPVCPACSHKLYKISPAAASHRCPYCNAEIIVDHRLPAVGYSLPDAKKSQKEDTPLISGIQGLIIMSAVFVGINIPSAATCRTPADQFLSRVIIGIGIAIIAVSLAIFSSGMAARGIAKLLGILGIFRSQFCPNCGGTPKSRSIELSGNCPDCGIRLLEEWPPDEPEPLAPMIDFRKLRFYCRCLSMRTAAILSVGLFFCFRIEKRQFGWLEICIMAGLFLLRILQPIIDRMFQKRLGISLKCPYCGEKNENHGVVLRFGRCTKCRRMIVSGGGGRDSD
ncbi:MAG: hypothetical protein AB7F40_11475 [Victivallaceae bacterium]|nr:hypothetical protein [Victivallaceae bacterium]